MNSRYQYIVTFLAMRDAVAVQLFAMAAVLLAPLVVLHRWPRLVTLYGVVLTLLVYGLAIAGAVAYVH